MKQEIQRIRAIQDTFVRSILTKEEVEEVKADDIISYDRVLLMYGETYIKSVEVFAFNDNRFIINKKDMSRLHTGWKDTLEKLSKEESLINPVFVDVDSDGRLLVN